MPIYFPSPAAKYVTETSPIYPYGYCSFTDMQTPAFTRAPFEVYYLIFYIFCYFSNTIQTRNHNSISCTGVQLKACFLAQGSPDLSGKEGFLSTAWAAAHAAECCFLHSFPCFGCCTRYCEKSHIYIYVCIQPGADINRGVPAFQTLLVMHAWEVPPALLAEGHCPYFL